MRGGDLTSQLAPAVGVIFEEIVRDFTTGKPNPPGKAFLESLVNKNFNIYLLTLMDERKTRAFCFKWAIPYTNVIQCDSVLEVPEVCWAHHLSVFYSTNERLLESVRSRGNPRCEAKKWEQ